MVRLPSWGCIGMSVISKLSMLGAAGAGGDSYWISSIASNSFMKTPKGEDVVIDSSDNIYVVAETTQSGSNTQKGALVKYSTDGEVLWAVTYNGSSTATNTRFHTVRVDSNNDIICCGQDTGNFVVCKYNSSGSLTYQKKTQDYFGTPIGMSLDSSDNIYFVTDTSYLVKLNSSGVFQFSRLLSHGSSYVGLQDMTIAASGNIYVCGQTNASPIGPNVGAFLAKYNSSGTLQWQRGYGGTTGSEYAYGVALDGSENIYTTGRMTSFGAGSNDTFVIKHNSSGTLQFTKTLGGGVTEYGFGMAVDANDNVLMCGMGTTGAPAYNAYLLALYNSSGTLQWQRALGTGDTMQANRVAFNSTGDILVTGQENLSSGNWITAKLPADGSLTGTYGRYYYITTTFTDTSHTITNGTTSLSSSSPTTSTGNGNKSSVSRTVNDTLTSL